MRDLPGCWCGDEWWDDDLWWFEPVSDPVGEWDEEALKACVDDLFDGGAW